MAVRLDLSRYKASGIYTVILDNSENPLPTTETARLVVGFSKKGPFNTLVYCPDRKTAIRAFGDVDYSLERKGSFFHRSLKTCLKSGPVYALNLLAVDNGSTDPDKVGVKSFSVNLQNENKAGTTKLLSSFFNKQGFWTPDTANALASIGTTREILNFVNLSKTTKSIVVKKTKVTGFDVRCDEWFLGQELEVPACVNPNDYVSDYFVEVLIVEGDYSNSAALSGNPLFASYFEGNGLKVDKIDNFLDLPTVTVVSTFTGCLIPDFQGRDGANLFIESIVNASTPSTGIFCAIDRVALEEDKIDLIGHGFETAVQNEVLNFLSYNVPTVNEYQHLTAAGQVEVTVLGKVVIKSALGTSIYTAWKSGLLTNNDYVITNVAGTKVYLKFQYGVDATNPFVTVSGFDAPLNGAATATQVDLDLNASYAIDGTSVSAMNIVSFYGDLTKFVDAAPAKVNDVLQLTQVVANATNGVAVGDYVVGVDGLLVRVHTVAQYDIRTAEKFVKITATGDIKLFADGTFQLVKPLERYAKHVSFSSLSGFTLKAKHMPDGSDVKVDKIYDVLYNTNLARALSDKNVKIRYIVDTFSGGLSGECKSRLTRLAQQRNRSIAFINVPSMAEFQKSVDPIFTDAATADEPNPTVQTRYIAEGGNLALNPTNRFSLATLNNGAAHTGIGWPYLLYRENGRNFTVPPAAAISNLFVEKFKAGVPFAVAAGRRGIISDDNLIGLEVDLLLEDREYLEPMGINPIIRLNGAIQLYGDQSGFQTYNSALNDLHVRDVLITLEEEIEVILSPYIFQINEDSIRLEIESVVRNYLETVKTAGGIINFQVAMNSSNNTSQLIDNGFGIVDVVVEPTRSMKKFINKITLTRSGGISSGFSAS